ncbi:MAG: hypothetical protein GY822_13955 [Deltaproteobacteria bacterium]|nr:hypothetical protein [Deltaproteobacteria bacterium]
MSRPKIGQILILEGRCDRETLMLAWEQKVLFGDRLGTNLLAIAALNEKSLALSLGTQAGVPAAWGEAIAIDPEAKRRLSPLIAKKRNVVPHHIEGASLFYLTVDPSDPETAAEIFAATRLQPVPVVVCEVRMWELQNEHYGVNIGMRPIDLNNPALKMRVAQEEKMLHVDVAATEELTSEDDFYALYQGKSGQAQGAATYDETPAVEEDQTQNIRTIMGSLEIVKVAPTLTEEIYGVGSAAQHAEHADLQAANMPLDAEHEKTFYAEEDVRSDFEGQLTSHHEVVVQGEMSSEAVVETDELASHSLLEPVGDSASELATSAVDFAAQDALMPALSSSPSSEASRAADVSEKFAKPTLIQDKVVEDGLAGVLDPLPELSADLFSKELVHDLDDSPLSFDEATAALENVRGRSEIARVVLRYALTGFSRAALLTVHPRNILGWEGIGDGVTTARLSTFRLPRSVKSVFTLVAESRAHYIGPLQRWPGNGIWVKHSGRILPQSVALFPVLVRGQVVNLLYGDNGHGKHVQSDVGELMILAQRISASYENLIRR